MAKSISLVVILNRLQVASYRKHLKDTSRADTRAQSRNKNDFNLPKRCRKGYAPRRHEEVGPSDIYAKFKQDYRSFFRGEPNIDPKTPRMISRPT
jgi:hypothetical protein